ncbi:MAG: hypothetical protein C4291_04555 [Candidatus Dadabacteria bacterium]
MRVKILFLILAVMLGFGITYLYNNPYHPDSIIIVMAAAIGIIFGAVAFGVLWGLEPKVDQITPRSILGGAIGMAIASLAFFAFKELIEGLRIPHIAPYILIVAFLWLFYIGIRIGMRKGWEADQMGKKSLAKGDSGGPKILDTSGCCRGWVY